MLTSFVAPAVAASASSSAVSFVVVSDWGSEYRNDLTDIAASIAAVTRSHVSSLFAFPEKKPHCVFALGDNFYHVGVADVCDKRWDAWIDIFGTAPSALQVPWYVAAGNHDYHPAAGVMPEFNFAFSARNPNGMWRMHGEATHDSHGNRRSRDEVLQDIRSRYPASTRTLPLPSALPPPPSTLPPPPSTLPPPPLSAARAEAREQRLQSVEMSKQIERTYYQFSIPIGDNSEEKIDCFVLDTCAAQYSIRRNFPHLFAEFPEQKQWLISSLRASSARWKFVFGHHPLYTAGVGHQDEARCLRGKHYTCINDMGSKGRLFEGLGLEQVLLDHGVDAYFAGHEHAFQYTHVQEPMAGEEPHGTKKGGDGCRRGFHHFGCGNTMEISWWRGRYEPPASTPILPPPPAAAECLKEVLADPYRSVCSTDHHVDEVLEIAGITHCEVLPNEFVVRLVSQRTHEIAFERRFAKQKQDLAKEC